MTIDVKIILDSYTDEGVRVTTYQLRYPRLIHSELMTHRLFSRNASSSRAIPVPKLIQDVIDFTAKPFTWGRNKPGMQAGEDWNAPIKITEYKKTWFGLYRKVTREVYPYEAWNIARDRAIEIAQGFADAEYHKQCVNRLLEPFSHINVVVTSTDFNNWFALRYHKDADPTIAQLARKMYEAYTTSEPFLLRADSWHLPYVTLNDKNKVMVSLGDQLGHSPKNHLVNSLYNEMLIKISVARCARVSYKTHDGRDTTVEEDIELYDRLLASEPLHASPAEHQCKPDYRYSDRCLWMSPELHGNLRGVIQYRKTLKGEFQPTFTPQTIT